MKKKQKRPSWQARLAQSHKLPPAPPADTFWADFRAQARDLPRQAPVTVPPAARRAWAEPHWWPVTSRPWAAVAACAALLLALLGWWQWPAPAPGLAAAPTSSQVLEVAARSGAFFILRDEQHQGMILWLVADERPALNGG
ncbi:MAG: hypothetical protein K9N49_00955 [Candidatus Marinimicrobia bacterium]|nr:hypothetical protein [Candidatus Neomarinimicrobiota bacterium]